MVDCVATNDDEDGMALVELEDHRTLLSYGITYCSLDEMVCELPDKHTLKVLMGKAGAACRGGRWRLTVSYRIG